MKGSKPQVRGVATLAVLGLLTAMVLTSPVGAAITKKKVKKTAAQVFDQKFPAAFAGAFAGAFTGAASGLQTKIRWALYSAGLATGHQDGIVAQSGGITVDPSSAGTYFVGFGEPVNAKAILTSLQGKHSADGSVNAVPCGGGPGDESATACSSFDDTSHVLVTTYGAAGNLDDRPFFIAVFG